MTSMATKVLSRSLCTSAFRCAKPGYFIYKLLEKEKYIEERAKAWEGHQRKVARVVPHESSRRQTTLNALYMDAITSIMASEFAADLQKFQIQIHGVRIKKDLKTVVVYWSCDESGLIDEEAKAALENIETPIRRELSAVRHMGIIPKVKFMFYVGASTSFAVHSLLDQLRKSGELDDVEPAPLPIKRYPQVFGLDRDKIMAILAAKSLPADFLKPKTDEDRKADEKSTKEFAKRFRAESSHRLRNVSLRKDFKGQREAEQLVLEEQFNKHRSDDTYNDILEENYFDDYDESDDRWNGDDWNR